MTRLPTATAQRPGWGGGGESRLKAPFHPVLQQKGRKKMDSGQQLAARRCLTQQQMAGWGQDGGSGVGEMGVSDWGGGPGGGLSDLLTCTHLVSVRCNCSIKYFRLRFSHLYLLIYAFQINGKIPETPQKFIQGFFC